MGHGSGQAIYPVFRPAFFRKNIEKVRKISNFPNLFGCGGTHHRIPQTVFTAAFLLSNSGTEIINRRWRLFRRLSYENSKGACQTCGKTRKIDKNI